MLPETPVDEHVMRYTRPSHTVVIAQPGRTISDLVETALRPLLRSQRKRETIAPLPPFHSGGAVIDIADHDALYQAIEGR
jgi:hypothetical protein